jgi:regulator of replication initiation timing
MSEDIHKWTDGRYVLMFDEHTFFVWDNEKDERMCALEVTKKLNEQQAIIRKLQDLCGKSDGENMKLRIENKRLQKELNDCEKFRYTVFKRLNDEHIKERSIK